MSETVAVAIPIFESVKAKAFRAIARMIDCMARQIPAERLWWLAPNWERRTYPFCVQGMVEEMIRREQMEGRRADWFFWLEDDIVPPADVYFALRQAADAKDRPYVGALAYCRTRPYWVGAAMVVGQAISQVQKVPQTGTIPVDRLGMCACLIHRSLFDRIPEPWFEVRATRTEGIGPDASWARKLLAHGVQPYLCCDVEVGHLSEPVVIGRQASEAFNAANPHKAVRP